MKLSNSKKNVEASEMNAFVSYEAEKRQQAKAHKAFRKQRQGRKYIWSETA